MLSRWRARADAVWEMPAVRFLRRRTGLLALLGYVAVVVAILWPSMRAARTLVPGDLLNLTAPYRGLLGTARPHNVLLSDPVFEFFPWFNFLGEGLRHGGIPHWNPFLLGGVPVSPSGYVSAYYPLYWLPGWISPLEAYDFFVAIHLVVAALGVYAFSRVLGCRVGPSWVVGLLALTSDFWMHWSLHLVQLVAFALLPWVLAAVHLAVTKPSRRAAAALALAFGLWWLGGNPQYTYFGTLATAGYAAALLVRRWVGERRPPLRSGLALGGGLLLGVALAAPALLPGLAIRGTILRDREPVEAVAHTQVPVREAIRALVPDATGNPADGVDYAPNPELEMDSPFVGVSAVLLCAAALATVRRPRWLLVLGAAAVLLLAFAGPPNRVLYDLVPGYDQFRVGARWLGILPAFALPLAAIGLDAVLRGERWARLAAVGAGAVSVVLVGGWYAHERGLAGAPHVYLSHRAQWAVAIVAAVVLAAVMAKRRPRSAGALILVCVLAEVFFHTPRWFPRVPHRDAYPAVAATKIAAERGGRVIRVAPGPRTPFSPITPDLLMVYGAADAQGFVSFLPKASDRYLRLVDDYGNFAKDNNVVPALSDPAMLRSPLLDALDVRTVISTVAVDGMPELATEPFVYGRASSGPAVVVGQAEPATEAGMWRAIASPDWKPDETAFVVGLPGPLRGGGGTVTGRRLSNDRERWSVVADRGGFLVVSGAWDRGWHARVDGRSVPVRKANGLFRGVAVAPGRHVVDFSFRNAAERRGLLLGAVAVVVLCGLALSSVGTAGLRRWAFSVRRRDAPGDGTSPTASPPPEHRGGRPGR
jgi:membrane protein YfhO